MSQSIDTARSTFKRDYNLQDSSVNGDMKTHETTEDTS